MIIEDEVLERWSGGGLEERRPPARRCVRKGHLFGVHALACSGSEQKGNMLKHAHPTFASRLFGVHALACSEVTDGGNMLKHGHPTVARTLMKHRTPNFERRTLNWRNVGRLWNIECSTFPVPAHRGTHLSRCSIWGFPPRVRKMFRLIPHNSAHSACFRIKFLFFSSDPAGCFQDWHTYSHVFCVFVSIHLRLPQLASHHLTSPHITSHHLSYSRIFSAK
jgi:hypothetical protein